MSAKLEIKDFEIADNLLYKSMKVGAQGKGVQTPIKAIDISTINPKLGLKRELSGFTEIHKTFYEKEQYYKSGKSIGEVRIPSIDDINRDTDLQEQVESRLIYLRKKAGIGALNFCFLEYVGNSFPNQQTMEYLSDLSYVYSDIIPLPIISFTKDIKSEDDFSSYLKFLKYYLEELDVHNNKPIMGIIPNIGRAFLDDLFDFYYDNDINAFYFDFEGKTPIKRQPNIRKFFRKLERENMLEDSFIHATNVYSGRFLLTDEAINARDILSFGLGFDSMGRNKRKPPPPHIIKKIRPSNRFRLFSKADYGYYQLDSRTIAKIYPSDSDIQLSDFLRCRAEDSTLKNYLQNNFNMEQQSLEAIRLRTVIRKEKPEEYLNEKKYLNADDFDTMKKVHQWVLKGKSERDKTRKVKSLFSY